MSEIIIEPIAEDNEEAENETDLPQALPAEDVPSHSWQRVIPEPTAQPKRKPGRPRGSTNKAKAAPPAAPKPKARAPPKPKAITSDNDESSSSEEDQRILGNLMQDDMETQILQFLTARKKDQANKRHTLWTNLAASGLRWKMAIVAIVAVKNLHA